jgi:hypothetical protein
MGFQVLVDLVGAMLVGGLFFLSLLTFNAQNSETKRTYRDEITSQANLMSVVEELEANFRTIGYCKVRSAMTSPVVIDAGADYISFQTDFAMSGTGEGDGVPDTISYRLGHEVVTAGNPKVRMLYRKEGGGAEIGANLGITTFDLQYIKFDGDTLSRPVAATRLKEIAAVQVTVEVVNLYPYRSYVDVDSLLSVRSDWKQLRFEIKSFGKGAI